MPDLFEDKPMMKKRKKIRKKRVKSDSLNEKPPNPTNKEGFQTKSIVPLSIDTIESLKIIKKLGSGATSNVFKVESPAYKSPGSKFTALKVLIVDNIQPEKATKKKARSWSDDSDDEENEDNKEDEHEKPSIDIEKVKRFFMEYEFINGLEHDNIVKAFGIYYGTDDASHPPSILLEYYQHTLAKSLDMLDEIDLVQIIYELCSVMKYVHSCNLIHRDLKPENILLDADKNVKLCDFGIAKIIEVEQQTKTQTQSLSQAGTLPYMAPELLEGTGHYDRKVDVYAFGVLVFFVIEKHLPRIGIVDVMKGKKAEIPKSFSKLAREMVTMCWAFQPEERPEFEEILRMMIDNNLRLFDGIDDKISDLKRKLNLS